MPVLLIMQIFDIGVLGDMDLDIVNIRDINAKMAVILHDCAIIFVKINWQ